MRFETNYRDEDTGWAGGVFQYTWMIDEDSEAGEEVRARVKEFRRWFNAHLPAPPKEGVDRRAIFWFKMGVDLGKPGRVSPWKRRPLTKLAARVRRVEIPSDRAVDRPAAEEVIERLKELVRLMEERGIVVRVITTNKPGYVVFEDAYQIAAIPFQDGRQEHEVRDWARG